MRLFGAILLVQWIGGGWTFSVLQKSGIKLTQLRLLGKSPGGSFTEATFTKTEENGYGFTNNDAPPAFSVYNILHPNSFPVPGDGLDNSSKGLHAVLEWMRSCVETLHQSDHQLSNMASDLLRIQHNVAALNDPLQWLSRQELRAVSDVVYLDVDDVQVAAVGATLQTTTEQLWLHNLPENARWYGGSRFDRQRSIGDEWKEFGTSYWILPSLELVRQDNTTTLAVHLARNATTGLWNTRHVLDVLQTINSDMTHRRAPTTLPPILSRTSHSQEVYENAVTAALHAIDNQTLRKVVLARKSTLQFGAEVSGLDIIRKWKYGGHEGGSLFYLKPLNKEFFGCTPETLFTIRHDAVHSEALAGTRPRGTSQNDDQALLKDLVDSPKDQLENQITGLYIEDAFDRLVDKGYVQVDKPDDDGYFVRRLLHLQHICKRYSARLTTNSMVVAKELFTSLHPTPAVAGLPLEDAKSFIRHHESFDRGFYAGPVGFIGRDHSHLVVAIRSGLATTINGASTVAAFAGSGLVQGSTLRGEWTETNYKFAVISSLFPQSPVTLRGAITPNVAWANAFMEELVRNGVTTFYVCPGSRSTPLVVALAKASRAHPGIVRAISVHDERAAGFRAVGYARGSGHLAAVITSSGTAVANLYPAVVEASMDGLPLLLLTADRPYESRNTGANQAIDQVKIFSDTYIRWFRDSPPPSDDVPVSVALSDACHAVMLAREQRGPVHLNMQFRENLAPDSGSIRNDDRVGSETKFDDMRFTDAPGFERWSNQGSKWYTSYSDKMQQLAAVDDVARLIQASNRGIIVVGNVRPSMEESAIADQSAILQSIADFATSVGFPIFAGAQSSRLRFSCSAVVPFAEHILGSAVVAENLKPDLVIQIGSPIVSTALVSAFKKHMPAEHVLIHPHTSQERADPEFFVSHRVSSDVTQFLNGVQKAIADADAEAKCHSELAPLVLLGRILQKSMKSIILEASKAVVEELEPEHSLTEPQVTLAMSEIMTGLDHEERSIFLSNSMPVRDTEMFFYPYESTPCERYAINTVGTNRGASGIDGIVSSALGLCDATDTPTTLLIGDLAALHDIGSFHAVVQGEVQNVSSQKRKGSPLTTVIVNNDGGGIFSFLPIAKHGEDVMFEDFFGTPTSSFSFQKGADAVGLPAKLATSYESFCSKYKEALIVGEDTVLEARVTDRKTNVAVHRKISRSVDYFIESVLKRGFSVDQERRKLPVKTYSSENQTSSTDEGEKTLVLLHGWLGDKLEWDDAAKFLLQRLGPGWRIVSIDLPAHGADPVRPTSPVNSIRTALSLEDTNVDDMSYSITGMAESVLYSICEHHHIARVDALAGYSAGGRIALAMKRMCLQSGGDSLISPNTPLVLLGANPGDFSSSDSGHRLEENRKRSEKDDTLARDIIRLCNRDCLSASRIDSITQIDSLLAAWYSSPIWGDLQCSRRYHAMIRKRSHQLTRRGREIAAFLSQASPPRSENGDWRICDNESTLFIAGSEDSKYSKIGVSLMEKEIACYQEIDDSGHALLVERPEEVANAVADFLLSESSEKRMRHASRTNRAAPPVVGQTPMKVVPESALSAEAKRNRLWSKTADKLDSIDSLEFSVFSTSLISDNGIDPPSGIGWGDSAFDDVSANKSLREGLIIQLRCTNGLEVGLGEVSPLPGMHTETLEVAKEEILYLKEKLQAGESKDLPCFEAEQILRFNGSLVDIILRIAKWCGLENFSPSVHSGLEMAVLSLAAQKASLPIHQALASGLELKAKSAILSTKLPLNGLITRGQSVGTASTTRSRRSFPSMKIKVGQNDVVDDINSMQRGFQLAEMYSGPRDGRLRADANRAWNESQAVEFASALEGLDLHAIEKIEYIEEPLQKTKREPWTLETQVEALERNFLHTTVPYALDESIMDLIGGNNWKMDEATQSLREVFGNGARGCAAFVLKPAILGMERSLRIARLAREELGIAAVFSSSFDSGLGLAHASMLAHAADQLPSKAPTYPHGVGTFTCLGSDTLTPPFSSFVDGEGLLNVASLSRALYGLSLEELQEFSRVDPLPVPPPKQSQGTSSTDKSYEASTATSGSGTEISVVANLPLPFSAETAKSRFTDLPSMSRWSPWVSSVQYFGSQTEWHIDVRGIPLKWRAESQLVDSPFPGIEWQSVSGISNRGIVEFAPEKDDPNSCTMNVRMSIVTPRLLRPLFQGTSLFVEEFLRDKLVKWSLEMFRDAVKADLALERGDVELGDALIGAVEGKATAIEATLSIGNPLTDKEFEDN